MSLVRDLQRELLMSLKDHYPMMVNFKDLATSLDDDKRTEFQVVQNLIYLDEHGLAEVKSSQTAGRSYEMRVSTARITHNGMDFLEDDGGLSAILGTVTVRLHADTIRDLIEARIASSDKPEPEKRKLLDALKTMPEEGLKRLITRLVDDGLSQAPGAWQTLLQMLS